MFGYCDNYLFVTLLSFPNSAVSQYPVITCVNECYLTRLCLQSFTSEFIYAEPLEVFPDSDEEICNFDDDPGTNDFLLNRDTDQLIKCYLVTSSVTWSHLVSPGHT